MIGDTTDRIGRFYAKHGYYFPIDVLSHDQAEQSGAKLLGQLESWGMNASERAVENNGHANPHVLFKSAYDIAVNARVLDAVGVIIGPDIMIWASTFFIKPPHSHQRIPWHQDLRHLGSDGSDYVTAWIALSSVTRSNGCMRYLPNSHKLGHLAHIDGFDDYSLVKADQDGHAKINEDQAVYVEMSSGQASLHHGYMLHASTNNGSPQTRIGLAINYLSPDNRLVLADRSFATLVRGKDRYGYFQQVPPPSGDLTDDGLFWHAKLMP